MDEEEMRRAEDAFRWVKENEQTLIAKFATPGEYETDTVLVSLFMAGSPGAGKTEVSKRLIQRFSKKPIRIDADEIRTQCPGYRGEDAHIFQKAANKGVNILYDHGLHEGLNLILDGTFAYGDAPSNIGRSLDKGRKVEIFFIYQEPQIAWEFTKKREQLEGRRVTKGVFINSFLKSKENVGAVKESFGEKVELNLVVKDFEKDTDRLELNITGIDQHLEKVYSRDELEAIII